MPKDFFYVHLRQTVKVVLPLDNTTETFSLTRGEICQIPGVSPALLGVVNQRGRLLWILDLSDLLKVPPSPKPLRSQDNLTLIVLRDASNSIEESATPQVACVVSSIKGIIPLEPVEFQPTSASISSDLKTFLPQTTAISLSPVDVLNVQAVLAAIKTSVTTISVAD